jgi:hypothetical protein
MNLMTKKVKARVFRTPLAESNGYNEKPANPLRRLLSTGRHILKRYIVPIVAVCLLTATGYLFRFGWLAPYSPFLFGFEKMAYARADVYYHLGAETVFPEDVDRSILDMETKLGLNAKRRIDIMLCRSDNENSRLTGSTTRAKTFPFFGRIVISRKLQDEVLGGELPLKPYIEHEIAHSLIMQHFSGMAVVSFPGWLNEGLAVWASDQFGKARYYSRAQVAECMSRGYYYDPRWWKHPWQMEPRQSLEFPLADKYYFIYAEFGCMVEDLMNTYGRDRFDIYFHDLLKGGREDRVFRAVFGVDFEDYLRSFAVRMTGD